MPRTRSKRARSPGSCSNNASGTERDGDAYLQRLIAEQIRADVADENPPSDVDDEMLDDADSLSVGTINSSDGEGSSAASSTREEHDPEDVALDDVSENEVGEVAPPEEINIVEVEEDETNHPPPALDEGDLLNLDVEDVADLPHMKGRSLLHHHIKQKKVVFLSLDLETGGEDCGIIQISDEIIRPELAREGGKVPKDTLANVTREGTLYNPETNPGGGLFNAYVHPGEDAEWSPAATEVTGLSRTDQRITSAKNIDKVWSSFSQWVESNIAEDEVGVIVAYHGAGSDMKWIWRLCMVPKATQTLPRSFLFNMDPLKMIKKWKSMNIHPKKSKLESLSLSSVYCPLGVN